MRGPATADSACTSFGGLERCFPPNKGLKLPSRLAALAGAAPRLYPEVRRASAAKAPARSLSPIR
jgi:hypothetical protein